MISLVSFWQGVHGGEIPEVNGVFGGVPLSARTVRQREVLKSASVKRNPKKLRGVVENSGVCGWLVPSLWYNSTFIMLFFRDDSRSLSSFRVWRLD